MSWNLQCCYAVVFFVLLKGDDVMKLNLDTEYMISQ